MRKLGRIWGGLGRVSRTLFIVLVIGASGTILVIGNHFGKPDMCGSTPCPDWNAVAARERASASPTTAIPLQPGVTLEQKIEWCVGQTANLPNDAYTVCMKSADTKVGYIEHVEMDTPTPRYSTNTMGTPSVAHPSSFDHNREYNQRMQDRVDHQDYHAMQQMQRSERFDNRMNAQNFRRGGR